ncbi:TlyA family RNA methyltransferase [Papillibacter cinnamivorans]|uniref:23S rRNA (Cytidine1920-2'-O)/16S rRNA (Cytidine1409-2'-O)-methyltransferase n=1 Tax=Papillibacter cinnamivorans DSM 12816 TaxID=1122930 RepID=A0A1W2CKK2_9FIRM|nr:TlyA family RNA methyltransferase [Papillibacter cinnamivorans]SMC85422.1 23S rRNA (cytidine1920-2'-O)/16S rRNA (cytidine1409-2'-O)-methyltransferase [Papillibacter cinnamivorans DSM 12816]
MTDKVRLDVLLCSRALAESRERARSTIMSGLVYVNGQKSDKPGTLVSETAQVEVRGNPIPFVSRGGLKLQKALDYFGVDPKGLTAIDVGASTGGFTDCLLKRGAEKVFAVDVGYGQLAWSVRTDPRVVPMERTNIRYLTPGALGGAPDLAVIDVSFISLRLVLPVAAKLLKPGGHALCLIKPQFEAGKEKVGKKGVVRDPEVHLEVLEGFLKNASEAGFSVLGITHSPIRGPEGNIEYLGYLSLGSGEPFAGDLKALVRQSHDETGMDAGS